MQSGICPSPDYDEAVEEQKLDDFSSLLTEGKTVFQVGPNIQIQRWEKVAWNAAWNALTTLTLPDTHTWLNSSPGAMPLTRMVMREVIDVARACDVPIEYELIVRLIEKIPAISAIGSSMHNDFESGKRTEVDIILGDMVRKAKELSVSVPTLETVHVILTGVNV